MALKQLSRLNKKQTEFVYKKLKEEEKKPNSERIQRIREARRNAKEIKTIYH